MTESNRRARAILWKVALAPLAAAVVGSGFNIWFNVTHVEPLLSGTQHEAFQHTILLTNLLLYPAGLIGWLWIVFSIRPGLAAVLGSGEAESPERLEKTRARAINLPWHCVGILGAGWLACAPIFLLALSRKEEPMHDQLAPNLITSISIAAFITMTHAFFIVEVITQKLLFPVLFRYRSPTGIRGAVTLTLGRRGLMSVLAVSVCPIGCLLLLGSVEAAPGRSLEWFRLSVGALGIGCGLVNAWLLVPLVVAPINALSQASREVATGNLDVQIELRRADELGVLIEEFNRMVSEMRAKERLMKTFGMHVGEEAAREILARNPGLGGGEREVTILFCDIRGFTATCENREPAEVVELLNRFFTEMVDEVEGRHGGMVNKFLGDGFMALFGAGAEDHNHADRAIDAGSAMLSRLERLNGPEGLDPARDPLRVGIGIHTGMAIIGNIGSERRLEYTAIGDCVNTASRVEALTKELGRPLLVTEPTRRRASSASRLEPLGSHPVRGRAAELELFAVTG